MTIDSLPRSYDFRTAERRWQEEWERSGLYRASDDDSREKAYILEMLPYPSGDLHVGHAKNYTLGDAVARMTRMHGKRVIHPMGWDAFGLPAENAAIKFGLDPELWTRQSIADMHRQIRLMGTGYDWSREITTCDPEYYRWNQWIFLRMYEDGLAYKREAPVNWCPQDQTVLANEQVENGRCWRCGSVIERRNLSQWFFKITAYADRLLESIEHLPGWPERIKKMQRHWIGRSEGTTFSFALDGIDERVAVYTTRIDTVFGVSYVTVAPEHPVVEKIMAMHPAHADAVRDFTESLTSKSELERTQLMAKAGVFTGAHAIHPLTGIRIPIWVANYVLAEYGTGAVMGVPGHDQRDFEFAQAFGLPIVRVIAPSREQADAPLQAADEDDGVLVRSGEFTGSSSADARRAITAKLAESGIGEATVNYRIRDWLLSRQRYWGTPIPIIYCEKDGMVAVPDKHLPVVLPLGIPITGEGSPLAKYEPFMEAICPRCGGPARRDPDTMDTFVDSSWYYLRYLDPHNDHAPFDRERVGSWVNVDQYIGGAEHAVMHLLYARFFYKYFHDKGWVTGSDEPFERLFNQGMVLRNNEKMSKSRGNVIGIDQTAQQHGVDAMRMFLLKATPPEDSMEWTDEGIAGRVRFLDRVWRVALGTHAYEQAPIAGAGNVSLDHLPLMERDDARELVRAVHAALQSGSEETISCRFHYNTTLARLDELVNSLTKFAQTPGATDDPAFLYGLRVLPILLAPFAPHIAEELWHQMGRTTSVHLESWPTHDEAALTVTTITLVVQINGKIRARIEAEPGLTEEAATHLASNNGNIREHLQSRTIRKRVYVPDKLLNFVV